MINLIIGIILLSISIILQIYINNYSIRKHNNKIQKHIELNEQELRIKQETLNKINKYTNKNLYNHLI